MYLHEWGNRTRKQQTFCSSQRAIKHFFGKNLDFYFLSLPRYFSSYNNNKNEPFESNQQFCVLLENCNFFSPFCSGRGLRRNFFSIKFGEIYLSSQTVKGPPSTKNFLLHNVRKFMWKFGSKLYIRPQLCRSQCPAYKDVFIRVIHLGGAPQLSRTFSLSGQNFGTRCGFHGQRVF